LLLLLGFHWSLSVLEGKTRQNRGGCFLLNRVTGYLELEAEYESRKVNTRDEHRTLVG
jgi:hypothetical protein